MNAAYLRVSTQEQDAKDTQATQRSMIENQPGISINEWFVEQESGATDDRPELNRLISSIEAGRIKTLYVASMDRLSRSLIHTLQAIQLFKTKKISFHALRDNFHMVDGKLEPNAEFMLNMTAAFAEHERQIIRTRTIGGKRRKQALGLWVTGAAPLGYELDRVSKVLRINEQEADLVRRIFDLRLSGVGINSILKRFNQERVAFPEQKIRFSGTRHCAVAQKARKTSYCRIRPCQDAFHPCQKCIQKHGGIHQSQETWSKTSVTKILKSKIYTGLINSNGQWIRGAHEPIITTEVFEAVQRLIAEATHRKERSYPHNPLAGRIYCQKCGRPMNVTSSTTKRSPYLAFICKGRRGGTCDQRNFSARRLYGTVDFLIDRYLMSDQMRESLSALYKSTSENYDREVTLELKLTRADLDDLQKKITKLNQAYVRASLHGLDDTTISGLLNDLRAAQDMKRELTDKLVSLESRAQSVGKFGMPDIEELAINFGAQWNMLTALDERPPVVGYIIRALIERVEVRDDEVFIKWRLDKELLDASAIQIIQEMMRVERVFSVLAEKMKSTGELTPDEKQIDHMEKHPHLLAPSLSLD